MPVKITTSAKKKQPRILGIILLDFVDLIAQVIILHGAEPFNSGRLGPERNSAIPLKSPAKFANESAKH